MAGVNGFYNYNKDFYTAMRILDQRDTQANRGGFKMAGVNGFYNYNQDFYTAMRILDQSDTQPNSGYLDSTYFNLIPYDYQTKQSRLLLRNLYDRTESGWIWRAGI